MKYYTITVNGNTYEVSVEENSNAPVRNTAPAPVAAPAASVAAPAPAPKQETATPAPKVNTGTAGSVKVVSPMPGKIITTKVNEGQTVKKGEVILILEAMKMENEIVAPQDGTITSINVSAGQSVEAGDLLATMN